MNSAKRSVEVTIRNELSQMTVISHSLERISREFKIPPEVQMQLQIALDEIVSNIIKYTILTKRFDVDASQPGGADVQHRP